MFLWTPELCSRSCLIQFILPVSTSADILSSHFIEALHLVMKDTWWSTTVLKKIQPNTSLPKTPIYYLKHLLFLLQPREQQWSLRLIGPVFFFLLTFLFLAKTFSCQKQLGHGLWTTCPTCLLSPLPRNAMISHLTMLISVIKWAE